MANGTDDGVGRLGWPFPIRLIPADQQKRSWRVGRLVLAGSRSRHPWPSERDLLAAVFDELRRQDVSVRYLVTPGGFLHSTVSTQLLATRGWKTSQDDFDHLRRMAQALVEERLGAETVGRACGLVAFLVLGVDVKLGG